MVAFLLFRICMHICFFCSLFFCPPYCLHTFCPSPPPPFSISPLKCSGKWALIIHKQLHKVIRSLRLTFPKVVGNFLDFKFCILPMKHLEFDFSVALNTYNFTKLRCVWRWSSSAKLGWMCFKLGIPNCLCIFQESDSCHTWRAKLNLQLTDGFVKSHECGALFCTGEKNVAQRITI